MKIHREGYLIIAIAVLFVWAVIAIFHYLFRLQMLDFMLMIAGAGFLLFIVQFFRDPRRYSPIHPDYILSPADGKVVVIEETQETEYLNQDCRQISIFMSPLDVHINRLPVSGTVDYIKYHPGKYLVAWHPKSSTENERTTFVIQTPQGFQVLFRQIAGAMARRIRYYIKEGQKVEQGNEFGFIKFGSRVDIFIPLNAKVKIKLGDRVKGGESILAELS